MILPIAPRGSLPQTRAHITKGIVKYRIAMRTEVNTSGDMDAATNPTHP